MHPVKNACTGLVAAIVSCSGLAAQTPRADLVLINGKIVTVDDRFSIAQAVAVKDDRIVAVGTNADVLAFAGAATRRIDLGGKTVVPGLIDNHMHLLRAGTTWQNEVRWDGVGSRAQALDLLGARVRTLAPGAWIATLGGWTIDQFADDATPFTREELDRVAPANPVLLQSSYYETYLNSLGLKAMGIDDRGPQEAWVVRDAAGRPTGRITEEGIRGLAAKLPALTPEQLEASTLAMIRSLNRSGLTAFGSAGCEPEPMALFRRLAQAGRLNVRVACITGVGANTPQQVDEALPRIAQMKPFQGDDFIDSIFYGESVYGPLHDPMFIPRSDPRPDQLVQWRRVATEIAKAGLPLHVHANLEATIDAFLDQIEAINREYPVKNLRWTLAHVNQLRPSHLARMRKLGLYAAVHPWAVINGGINRTVFGDAALDMAPLATIQQSGVLWGFGSDGSRANQILPFTTLWWAVTGKMVGGATVLRQPISREDALIAHTRRNAFFLFQESNLGSIQVGKLADLVVLDRDYLTVPADEIKDVRSQMTIIAGRVAYDAATETVTH